MCAQWKKILGTKINIINIREIRKLGIEVKHNGDTK